MLNIFGWVSFIFTSIVALGSAFSDYKEHKLKPRTYKYYLSILTLLALFLGIAIYPFDKLNDQKDKEKLLQNISQINKKTLALQNQNQEITLQNDKLAWQNHLLKKQIQLTSNDLKKYKSQISQLSVMFSAHFELRSLTNISKGTFSGFYMIPHVAISNEKNFNWVYFNSSPPNYSLSTPFIGNSTGNSIFYSYSGIAHISNGLPPIGQKLEALKEFNRFTIYIPMHTRIAADDYNNRNFKVNGCSLFFTINGVDLGKYRINCPEIIVARIGEFAQAQYKADFLTIQFQLKENLYDLLHLNDF